MTSKLAWRTAAVLGTLVILGYAGFVLTETTPRHHDPGSSAGMPGMEHEPETPGMQGTEPEAEMEHEGAEMGGHDMSPVDVNDAPASGPEARGGQQLQPTIQDGIKEFELTTGIIHPIHIHGGPFEIVATDGNPVPEGARLTNDTVLVGPGERYDIVWTARNPGKWLLHCHINHHITNDGIETQGGGGMTMVVDVSA